MERELVRETIQRCFLQRCAAVGARSPARISTAAGAGRARWRAGGAGAGKSRFARATIDSRGGELGGVARAFSISATKLARASAGILLRHPRAARETRGTLDDGLSSRARKSRR